jgi:predicted dithiol-disulfide oxidoreductase (DUF899 family)
VNLPPVVSADGWQAAHEELLRKKQEATRAPDALAAERRRQPMARIEKDYAFEGPAGQVRLLDSFEGGRQLIVYEMAAPPRRLTSAERVQRRSEMTRVSSVSEAQA